MKKYKSIAIFVLLLSIPILTNNYYQYLINMILVYILVTLGFNIILGYVGRFSFANASFFGIGAYTVGLLMKKLSLGFWFSLPVAGVVTAGIGLLVGFPALRLHRYYLAIVTLAFMFLMKFIYIHGGEFTYGPSGFDIPAPTLGSFRFANDKSIYYIILVTFFLLFLLIRNVIQSRIGRAFSAVREGENAAEALSIDSKNTVLLAFTLSGFILGIAGGLLSIVIRRITPDSFGMAELTRHFIMVVFGGLGSMTGSIFGATIILLLPEFLRGIQEYQEIIYGLLIVIITLFAPRGIYGFLLRVIPRISKERLYYDG